MLLIDVAFITSINNIDWSNKSNIHVDHKGVTCYGLRGCGMESRPLMTSEVSLMTSEETRDL